MILTAVATTITIGLRPWRRSGLLLTCTALTGFVAAPVHAQTVWTGFIDDEWNAGLNWDTGVVPNAATDVFVDSTYVNAPVIDGAFSANAASINIGGTAYPSILSIDDNSTLLTSGGPSFLGFGLDEEGQVNIEAGSLWDSADNVFIGFDGTGVLNLTDSSVIGGASAYLGMGEDGAGVVTLDNSSWTLSNLLAVGGAGGGALLASNGSTLTSLEGRIGVLEGSDGTVSVAAGATWNVTNELFLGDGGEGQMFLFSGGTVTSDAGILGVQSGSDGLASVWGTGTGWTTTSALGVGYEGIGQLLIFDQAQVAVGTDAFVGVEQTGMGLITIESQGDLDIAGSLNVGVDGHAAVNVQNGGTMSSTGGATVGGLGNGIGAVSVDGAGSGWTNTGTLVLGDFGNGRLTVTDGAGVTNISSTFLGLSESGTGALAVDNATFFTSDGLVVGGAGTGLMTISGGGTVTSTQNSGEARIGFGGTGDVVISDTGSSWTNHGQLFVGSMDIGGNAGQGALLVTDGAQFTNNGIAWLGHDSGSTGQAVVSGGTWDNTSSLYVGNEGNGLLVIEDGGLVTATNATIGAVDGSHGAVVANGTGIVWSNSGSLAIGGAGQAELAVGDGAIVVAQGALTAAALPTSSAMVTVNGVLAGLGGVTFNTDSHLSGAGTVSAGAAGTTTMNGTIAPGNSIGTLTIFGNYVQNAGSTYEVEIDAAGNSDLIDVSAMATLNGGDVVVVPVDGFQLAMPYTILTAAGGVNGQFDGASMASAFLTPTLSDDANNVYLTIQQSASFESAAMTPNQIATAQGADSLPTNNPVWTAIAMLPDAPTAQFAFDQLSGEVHGSAQTALIDDSRFVREAALNRIRDAFAGVGAANAPVPAYGEGRPELVSPDTERFAFWGHGFGSWGRWNSDGNVAQLDRGTGGLFLGGDLPLGDWRVGALAGYSSTNLDIDDRASSANVESWHLGLYGGTKWGDVAFRTGAAYSWHDLSTARTAIFPGFADSLTGDYGAGTGQFFGELAYDMDFGVHRLEPFANLAYVHQSRPGFTEQGGPAALTASSASTNTAFTTLGLRGETEVDLGGTRMTAHATLGWRHAFGDATPTSTHTFSGGAPFTIAGAPIARDAAVIEAGLDLRFSPQASFGLSYSGQLAGNAQSHGFTARLGVSF